MHCMRARVGRSPSCLRSHGPPPAAITSGSQSRGRNGALRAPLTALGGVAERASNVFSPDDFFAGAQKNDRTVDRAVAEALRRRSLIDLIGVPY